MTSQDTGLINSRYASYYKILPNLPAFLVDIFSIDEEIDRRDYVNSMEIPKRRTILAIDDNKTNLALLKVHLHQLGLASIMADNARDGIELAINEQPDIILLDIMMPRMSGFEVCRRLKNDPETRDIPIVIVTALNELGDVERGVDSGADDFISKPVNKLELLSRVKSLLRVRHLKSELERTLSYLAEIESEEKDMGS